VKGGTDQLALSTGIGGKTGVVNSPTVFNSAYNFKQFWDGRAETLEEQIDGPTHNPLEMDSNWTEIITKLEDVPRLCTSFQRHLSWTRFKVTTSKCNRHI
jgi:cytochrome c peroxidase